jgi:hypothetical protein
MTFSAIELIEVMTIAQKAYGSIAPNNNPENVKGVKILGEVPSVLNSETRYVYAPKRVMETKKAMLFENDLPTIVVVIPASLSFSITSVVSGPDLEI